MQSSEGADPRKLCSPLPCTCCLEPHYRRHWRSFYSCYQHSGQREERDVCVEHDFEDAGLFPSNAVPIMAQKSLVGHSKGGAAAWQKAGLLQSVESGVVPGNRDADNADAVFQQHSLLMFSSKAIQTDGISAGVMVRSH